jgi:hypothetical protein
VLRPVLGITALSLQRSLEIGSYPTAWAMLHRLCSVLVRPGRDRRWLLGTHQGSVDDAHLQSYLSEFASRFNRRRSRSRGLVFYRVLELAIAHDPVRYRDLVADPQPKAAPPAPPGGRGHPPSIDRPRAARPWRTADQG